MWSCDGGVRGVDAQGGLPGTDRRWRWLVAVALLALAGCGGEEAGDSQTAAASKKSKVPATRLHHPSRRLRILGWMFWMFW